MSAHTHEPWAPLADRLEAVARFRGLVAGAQEALCERMEAEIGKPAFEGFTADVWPVLGCCKWVEKHAKRVLAPRGLGNGGMLGLGQTHRVRRAPLGRVGIIATWNYPVGLLGVQLVQALAAGNRVVVKPSEHAPETQGLLMELACEALSHAGAGEGVLEVLPATREAGETMLREERLDHVVFTGSTGVGVKIAQALAPGLTPSTLELSGRDSAIVLADAPVEQAAKTIWWAATVNAGQTCMAPKRVLVEAGAYAAFVRALGFFAGGAKPRRVLSEAAASIAFEQVESAVAAGGRSVSGVVEPPEGAWMRAHAITDCPADAELVAGHNFAPVFAVVPVRGLDEALAIHGSCDQHLATSVWTARTKWAAGELAPRLGATTVTINDTVMPTAHPATSIGGRGRSGWGLSQGREGLVAMTRPVFTSTTSLRMRAPLDPPAPKRGRTMARWVAKLYGPVQNGRAGQPEPAAPAEEVTRDDPVRS